MAPGVFPLGLEVVSPASGAHSLDAHPMGIQFLHLAVASASRPLRALCLAGGSTWSSMMA